MTTNRKLKVTSAIIKNRLPDKPNEDNIWIDLENNVFLVVDGVSRDKENGIYPNPSPSAKLTESFVNFFKEHYNSQNSLKEQFKQANTNIEQINKHYIGYFKPGLVALCIRIKMNKLEWVGIGDCFGALIRNNKVNIFNTQQTEKLRKSEHKFDSKTIRKEICNNPNHSLAYGVFDGNQKADLFLETGEFNIESNDIVCIFTDGLTMFAKPELTKALIEKTPNEIISLAEEIEKKESIRTDDKTIIKIEF